MFKAINKLRDKKGFTLTEAVVSTAALASLMSIFALLPIYKVSLTRVNHRQRALSIIKEITSNLENQSSDTVPQVIIEDTPTAGQNVTKPIPAPGSSSTTVQVQNRKQNTTYNLTISSEYVDATDSDGDGDRAENRNDGSHTGRVLITVAWTGYRGGSISSDSVIYNTAIF